MQASHWQGQIAYPSLPRLTVPLCHSSGWLKGEIYIYSPGITIRWWLAAYVFNFFWLLALHGLNACIFFWGGGGSQKRTFTYASPLLHPAQRSLCCLLPKLSIVLVT